MSAMSYEKENVIMWRWAALVAAIVICASLALGFWAATPLASGYVIHKTDIPAHWNSSCSVVGKIPVCSPVFCARNTHSGNFQLYSDGGESEQVILSL